MAETEHPPQTQQPITPSFSIWPPSQRTRDAVIQSLIDTLSSPSVLSKRYGTVTVEEASGTATQIEEEAFNCVGSGSSDDDGIDILQIYSKEISKRMLDSMKARSSATPSMEAENRPLESLADASEQTLSSAPTEEVSSVETES
ncbi:unnamed protein product [Withania somnifera]